MNKATPFDNHFCFATVKGKFDHFVLAVEKGIFTPLKFYSAECPFFTVQMIQSFDSCYYVEWISLLFPTKKKNSLLQLKMSKFGYIFEIFVKMEMTHVTRLFRDWNSWGFLESYFQLDPLSVTKNNAVTLGWGLYSHDWSLRVYPKNTTLATLAFLCCLNLKIRFSYISHLFDFKAP